MRELKILTLFKQELMDYRKRYYFTACNIYWRNVDQELGTEYIYLRPLEDLNESFSLFDQTWLTKSEFDSQLKITSHTSFPKVMFIASLFN